MCDHKMQERSGVVEEIWNHKRGLLDEKIVIMYDIGVKKSDEKPDNIPWGHNTVNGRKFKSANGH